MAALFYSFVLGCCIFLAFQQSADCIGINCYSCASCGSTSASWNQTYSSSSGPICCFKYVYSFTVVSFINRGVSYNCSVSSDGNGGSWYYCYTDLCNGSISLSSSLGFAFALIAAVYIFKTIIIN